MKLSMTNIKTAVSKAGGRAGLVLKKHSPEILITAGVVGIVASTVMCCKATLKVDEILEESKETVEKIKEVHETKGEEIYPEQDYKRDLTITYVKMYGKVAKLYAPAVTLGVVSLGCILGAHGIMKKRNVALMAAYKAVEQSFSDYRKRVVEEFGERKDYLYYNGLKEETVTEEVVDEDGKKKKVKKTIEVRDEGYHSPYEFFFDESSSEWSKTPEYNKHFLVAQQNYFNNLLMSRGHVFLNEIHDALGTPRTQAGAVVGWVLPKDENDKRDGYIDLGLFDVNNESSRDFINGYERSILIKPNVDGVIYDLI